MAVKVKGIIHVDGSFFFARGVLCPLPSVPAALCPLRGVARSAIGRSGSNDARSLWNGMLNRAPAVDAQAVSAADIASANQYQWGHRFRHDQKNVLRLHHNIAPE
jgi:hypothetical protein